MFRKSCLSLHQKRTYIGKYLPPFLLRPSLSEGLGFLPNKVKRFISFLVLCSLNRPFASIVTHPIDVKLRYSSLLFLFDVLLVLGVAHVLVLTKGPSSLLFRPLLLLLCLTYLFFFFANYSKFSCLLLALFEEVAYLCIKITKVIQPALRREHCGEVISPYSF